MRKNKKKERLIFNAPKGTSDILPSDEKYWEKVESTAKNIARGYGFGLIEMPTFELEEIYLRGTGETSDVVEKQMYHLKSRGEKLVLRPEGTPGAARAYIQNGLFELPQPVRLYYSGSFFRHEQPQAARYRQFHQFGLEVFGEVDSIVDAEIIEIFFEIFNKLGLKNLVIEINSIGCKICRPKYKTVLTRYYRLKAKDLCVNCKRRLELNPLRLLDCKEESCQPFIKGAPQIIDRLCDDCKNHFKSLLEYLDELKLPYILNPHLVRGFDYYTKTVFEIFFEHDITNHTRSNLALGGGGRYDNLVKELGGRSVPAVGAAFGFERVIEQMKTLNIKVNEIFQPEIFIVQLGPEAKKKALSLFESLRKEGFKLAQAFSKDSLVTQLRLADRLKVKITLILGQKEIFDETIIIKEMATGTQETVPVDKLADRLKEKLK